MPQLTCRFSFPASALETHLLRNAAANIRVCFDVCGATNFSDRFYKALAQQRTPPSMAFACLLVCLLACLLACVLQRLRAPILMRFHRPQHPGIAHASVASLLEHREGLQPSIVPALSRHGPRAAGSNLASRHGGRQREETQ